MKSQTTSWACPETILFLNLSMYVLIRGEIYNFTCHTKSPCVFLNKTTVNASLQLRRWGFCVSLQASIHLHHIKACILYYRGKFMTIIYLIRSLISHQVGNGWIFCYCNFRNSSFSPKVFVSIFMSYVRISCCSFVYSYLYVCFSNVIFGAILNNSLPFGNCNMWSLIISHILHMGRLFVLLTLILFRSGS